MGVSRGLTTTRGGREEKLQRYYYVEWRVAKDGTEPEIRFGRGRREAVTTKVKVAGVSASSIKAKELDGPLAGRAWQCDRGGSRTLPMGRQGCRRMWAAWKMPPSEDRAGAEAFGSLEGRKT
jgi:hypothetical protein